MYLKTVVYLQLMTATWHRKQQKNDETWYHFSSTSCF